MQVPRAADAGLPDDIARLRSWLDSVGGIVRAVNRAGPLPELLDLIAATTCRLTGYDFCAVMIAEDAPPRLAIEGAFGFSADYVARVNVDRPIHLLADEPLGEGPTSRAFRSQRPVVVRDITADPTFGPWADLAAEEGYRSLLCVPIVASGGPLGVLNCYAIVPQGPSPTMRTLVETLADEAAIAIEAARLRAHELATIADLERLNASLERQRAVLERTEALHRELMAVALSGARLPAIVHVLSREIGRPVRLHGPEVPELTGSGPPPPPGAAELAVPIMLDGVAVGHLATAAAEPDASPDLLRRALESGALIVALELQRERTAHEVQSRLSRDLLGDVLSADETIDEWPVHRRADQLGHDLRTPHTVLVVRADDASATSPPVADPGQLQHRLVGVVRSAVERGGAGPRPLVAARNENVVVLWAPGPDGDARRLAAHVQRRVRERLGPVTVSVAIGATCTHLQEYASAHRVAGAALDLRRRTGDREAVLSLAELGVYQFLLQVRRPHELADYAAGLLDPLRAADRAALLPTLRAYLEHGMSTAETAKRMYVHVNTVAYRIRRISEILDLDLRDPDVLLNLRFALMIEDVLGRA